MPLVTVVTAAKNAAGFLPSAIESIKRQTLTDWHHVIVDDGSDDNTPDVVEAAAAHDSRVSLVRLPESIGAYAAANVAILAADSQFIARLDADDRCAPERLAAQVDALTNAPDAAANVTGWRLIDENDGVDTAHSFGLPTTSNAVMKWMLWLRGGPLHSSLLITTAYLQERGGYGPERIAEDYRLWCALTRDGKLSMLDRTLVDYRTHAAQITATKGTYEDPVRLRMRLEHYAACGAAGDWSQDDARDLLRIARWSVPPFGIARALELLDRWEQEWARDDKLSDAERVELGRRAARMRVLHVARAMKSRQSGAALEAARRSPGLLRAATRLRPGYDWFSD